jgi:2-C-methyl-D-erythritol 4-phosphate cytidylyltransferase
VVLIHDAARPLIDDALIHRSVKLALRYGACVAAVPESDTVKLVDDKLFIQKTLDRNRIFRAQTPQAFRMAILKKAYAVSASRGAGIKATDDSGLVEAIGCRVRIVESSYRNIKVTTKVDLKLAEVLL